MQGYMYYVLLAVEYTKFQIVNFGNEKYLVMW